MKLHSQSESEYQKCTLLDCREPVMAMRSSAPMAMEHKGGVIQNHTIGLYFIFAVLLNNIHLLPDDIPLRNRMWMRYEHDGCPAHNATVACNVLNKVYPATWIACGGPRTWPARSPDLTPLYFLLWGTQEGTVYQDAPTSLENMCNVLLMTLLP